jgi:hypothetical protein
MDHQIMEVLREAAEKANRHIHGEACGLHDEYAVGIPREGWFTRAQALAGDHGFRMQWSTLPRELNGDGCTGFTSGWVPRYRHCPVHGREESPFGCNEIHVQPGPHATRLVTATHELGHMLLRHVPRDRYDAERKARAKNAHGGEMFSEEVSCHLAGIACARAEGLKIRRPALCYLSDRVRHHGRLIGGEEIHAGFCAARQIIPALKGR